ncbi:hypothetical protein RR46_03796 [Papilio xuthus]|nr:hypothetical protein RR46_03796 [Papilio xuthus]
MILVDGYFFTRHAASGGKMRYRCCKYNIGCTACLYTLLDDSAVVRMKNVHNHPINIRRYYPYY